MIKAVDLILLGGSKLLMTKDTLEKLLSSSAVFLLFFKFEKLFFKFLTMKTISNWLRHNCVESKTSYNRKGGKNIIDDWAAFFHFLTFN